MQLKTLEEKLVSDSIEFLKAMSHNVRFEIVKELSKGTKCVTDIRDILENSQPNISKHLNILRLAGVVDYTKDKQQRCYFIADKRAFSLLKLVDRGPKARPDEGEVCLPERPVRSG